MKIQRAAQQLAADGRLDQQDVGKLIDVAKDWLHVSGSEKQALTDLLSDPRYASKFTPEAKRDLQSFLGIQPSGPAVSTGSRTLGQSPSGDPVVLRQGQFVSGVDGALPTTPKQVGDSLYLVASLIADSDPAHNVFAELTTADKQQVAATLLKALDQVPVNLEVPEGYDNALQARQQRASVATAMLEMMRSIDPASPQEKLLQDTLFNRYAAAAERETSSMLRDSMVFQLHNNRDRLVSSTQEEKADQLLSLYAPTAPPHDTWFKDGNNTLRVVCHSGGEFFNSEVATWKSKGFTALEGGTSSRVVLEGSFDRDGVETKVRLTMVSGSSGALEDMDDPETHVVVYSGHANWGRTIGGELGRSPDQEGRKLVIINQCCGRSIMNRFRDKYDEAQLITTRNSSYEREDFATLYKTLEGVAERQSWATIAGRIRDDVWDNRRDNYYFPNDAQLRQRAVDRDHDGIADVVDRLVNFNSFKVEEDTATEFEARDPGKSPDLLEGSKIHEAAQIINTTSKFSAYLEDHTAGETFISAGYFAPDGNDAPMVRIRPAELGGQRTFELEVNSHHAHATAEAIKAEAFYTVAHTQPFKAPGDSAVDCCLRGLIMAAHSLRVDDGYRDSEIFKGLLKHHGLPEIELYPVQALAQDGHSYGGSPTAVSKLKEKLGPEKLAALSSSLG